MAARSLLLTRPMHSWRDGVSPTACRLPTTPQTMVGQRSRLSLWNVSSNATCGRMAHWRRTLSSVHYYNIRICRPVVFHVGHLKLCHFERVLEEWSSFGAPVVSGVDQTVQGQAVMARICLRRVGMILILFLMRAVQIFVHSCQIAVTTWSPPDILADLLGRNVYLYDLTILKWCKEMHNGDKLIFNLSQHNWCILCNSVSMRKDFAHTCGFTLL